MDRETILILRVIGVIAVIVACIFGFGAKDPAVATDPKDDSCWKYPES